MKNFLPLVVLLVFLFSGCQKNEKELTQKNQELNQVVEERDSIIAELFNTLDEIEKNLGIVSSSDENQSNVRERMERNVSRINSLIQTNQNTYDSLNRIVYRGGNRYRNLSARLDSMNVQLNEKESRIIELNDQIAMLNTKMNSQDETIGNLRNTSSDQNNSIDEMTKQLNTAYFIVGDQKDLVEKKVVYKDGGFLGLFGRVERLDPRLNTSLFTQIDVRNKLLIDVQKENEKAKIKVVTIHPPESYNIKNVNDELAQVEITDPGLFWEASKYLVVVKE